MIPPRPAGTSAKARFWQWAHDELVALTGGKSAGVLTRVGPRGVFRIPVIPKPVSVSLPRIRYFEAIYPALPANSTPIQVTNGIAFEKATDGCSYTWGSVSNNSNTRGGFRGTAGTQSYRFRARRYRIEWENSGASARINVGGFLEPYSGVVIPPVGLFVSVGFVSFSPEWIVQNGVWRASLSPTDTDGKVCILQTDSTMTEFESRGSSSDMIAAVSQMTTGTKILSMRGANEVFVKSASAPTILESVASEIANDPSLLIESLTLNAGSTNAFGSADLTLTVNAWDLTKAAFIGFGYDSQGGKANAINQPSVGGTFWRRSFNSTFRIKVTALT